MQLKSSGIVNINGYHCLFTQNGEWSISRHGVAIGFVDSLAEVEGFIASNLEKIRTRLRRAQDEAAERNGESS
jgi:hypothetical protein